MSEKSSTMPVSRREFLLAGTALALSCRGAYGPLPENAPQEAFIVPNFHPASCGWLTNFSKERVYCAN